MAALTCSHGTNEGRFCRQCMDAVLITCVDTDKDTIAKLTTQVKEKDIMIADLESQIGSLQTILNAATRK